jgi:hypothetical protein
LTRISPVALRLVTAWSAQPIRRWISWFRQLRWHDDLELALKLARA